MCLPKNNIFKLVSVIIVNWHIYSYFLTLLLSKYPWKCVRFLGLHRLDWNVSRFGQDFALHSLISLNWVDFSKGAFTLGLNSTWLVTETGKSVQYVSISLIITICIVRLKMLVIGPVQSVTQSRDSNPRFEAYLLRKTSLSISVDVYVMWVAVCADRQGCCKQPCPQHTWRTYAYRSH